MLANGPTVSSLCVHDYVRTCCLLHSSLTIIRAINVLRVLNHAVASTGVAHENISLD